MEENRKEQEKKVEEKVDTLVDLCLQKTKLPFTYSRVEIVSCTYYDPNDYDVVLRFHGFNGQKYPHKGRIYCYQGNNSQTFCLDMGFPMAAVVFDNVAIPGEIVKELARAAYYQSEFEKRKEAQESGNTPQKK